MFKSIIKGFLSNRAGKLYLTSILILIISNIVISTYTNLYLVSTIAVILYILALIYYSRHMEINTWIMIFFIALTLVPMGVWLTLFYFARKNYTIHHLED